MSPWKSTAQSAWGHSPAGVKALGGKQAVAEWDRATTGQSLPKHVTKKAAKKR